MSKLAKINICLGFWILFFSSLSGAFVATYLEEMLTQYEMQQISNWQLTLIRSAHGHSSLFGMLHILFGLTFSIASHSNRIENWLTMGLLSGSFSMAILLSLRSFQLEQSMMSGLGVLNGLLLSFALIAILVHALGLTKKIIES